MGKKPVLVILDRDGVINYDSDDYIRTPAQWEPIKGSLEAIRQLLHSSIQVAVATNQSGIGRGYFSFATVHAMHQKMLDMLDQDAMAIGYIAICPHHPEQSCQCRKPNIGMLNEIAEKLMVSLDQQVHFVGDTYKDIQAARTAGCVPVLVKTGKGLRTLDAHPELLNEVMVFDCLLDYVESLS